MNDHGSMGRQRFAEAIGEAAEELARLETRAAHLRAFITEGKILLGQDDSPERPPSGIKMEPIRIHLPEVHNGTDTSQERTIGDWVRRYLEEVGQPMRVPEIAKILVERHWVTSRHAIGAIRTAMGRRDDFERIALGVYALKEWPASMKRWTHRTSRPLTPRKHRTVQQGVLPQLISAVMAEQGKPLTVKEVIEGIEAKGHHVNRASTIRAIYRCSKQNRFFYLVAPGTFGLLQWRNQQVAHHTTPAKGEETPPIEDRGTEEPQQGELSEAEHNLSFQSA